MLLLLAYGKINIAFFLVKLLYWVIVSLNNLVSLDSEAKILLIPILQPVFVYESLYYDLVWDGSLYYDLVC